MLNASGPARPKASRPQPHPQPAPRKRRRRGFRFAPAFAAALVVAGGIALAVSWSMGRSTAKLLEPPALTPEVRQAVLAALHPGWPGSAPALATALGPVVATEGRIDGVAAADVDGDGRAEWGVSYTWLAAPDPSGARSARPGFAVVRPGEAPELLYEAPGVGGFNGPKDGCFEDASRTEGTVSAVDLGRDGAGFLQHVSAEMTLGGRLSVGQARLFAPSGGGWGLAWAGETDHRQRQGEGEEKARGAQVAIEDGDGDGAAEIRLTPNRYERGAAAHFTAVGPGPLVYVRRGERYVLDHLAGEGKPLKLRQAAPLLAVRAPGPVRVDGDFADWTASELVGLSGLSFAETGFLKYKRRDPSGADDFSGDVRLMWDEAGLYVRAEVLDDRVTPGPAGRDLYQGDHVAVWLDSDLHGDFDRATRSDDDWQIGLSPSLTGGAAEAFAWIPQAGRHAFAVASQPLRDPYNGAVRGYMLEAALPWATLGGAPPGLTGAAAQAAAPTGPRTYQLRVAGAIGAAFVLSDADTEPQELVSVSNEAFAWSQPRTFNTLLLVEGHSP